MHKKETMNDVLQLDSPPATAQEALRAHVEKAMFKPIRPWERLGLIAVTFLCVGGGSACIVYFFAAGVLTSMQRFYLLITSPLAAGGASWCISTLRRGTFHTMKDDVRIPTIVWAFLVVILVVEILTGQPSSTITKTIAAIVVIGFPMTWDRMKASELRIQETILRAALHKSVQTGEPSQGTARHVSAENRDNSP